MGQSLTSRYIEAVQRSFAAADTWTWPRKRKVGEPAPDARLLGRNISGPVACLTLQNGIAIETRLRAVSKHDLVLSGSAVTSIPVMGQVVDVVVRWEERNIITKTQAIVHWAGNIAGQNVVALFTIEPLELSVEELQSKDSRGEVRFPLNLPAAIEVEKGKDVFGNMVDYSLSGCQFIAEEAVELDVDYSLTVLMPNASVEMTLRPRWVLNTEAGYQMGCTFAPEQGVLLACRLHPQPTGLSCPLRPLTNNWDGKAHDADSWS